MDPCQHTFAALDAAGWPQDNDVTQVFFDQLRQTIAAEIAAYPAEELQKLLDSLEKAIRRLDVERRWI